MLKTYNVYLEFFPASFLTFHEIFPYSCQSVLPAIFKFSKKGYFFSAIFFFQSLPVIIFIASVYFMNKQQIGNENKGQQQQKLFI